MATSTVENYLKTIYLEQERHPDSPVTTGRIAAALTVSPGTVTAMLKTLTESGLVTYEPYAGAQLTEAGTRLARHVLRRHRLVELFLVRIMGMDWADVHAEAEVLEHVVSERLIERIDTMLGRPSVDPHGDPIPTADGIIETAEYPSLLRCQVGAPLRVTRVIDQRAGFLQLLERHGLTPGRELSVATRDELAGTVEVRPVGGEAFQLGREAASRVLVEPL
ncbi:MAG TPA: metal-dependent transcriptional regulator [Candidatus Polarisedimenticolaceae bacterium]|nr:metal-dependent transcriptional regulator [Candidatus Polarisedimenticolaceae bacterium]